MIRIFSLFLLLAIVPGKLICQPQWKFHIAFEDASGAKDTIWMIWDTLAHSVLPVDSALGESSFNFDYSKFNVWVYNWDNDSTKTVAFPYSEFPAIGGEIYAFNYQYPLLISWDSSLFFASYLPFAPHHFINDATLTNDYFFFVNNDPFRQAFNMLIDTMVTAPAFNWFSQSQFPMTFGTGYLNIGIDDIQISKSLVIFPTIVYDELNIIHLKGLLRIKIFDLSGKEVFSIKIDKNNFDRLYKISLGSIPKGVYIIKVTDALNANYYEKFIKN